MSKMRELLGTRSRFHLSMEEFDPAAAPAPVATPSTEDTTVVMKGPLADVYSEALSKVYDKDAPIADPAATPEGTPAAQPEGNATATADGTSTSENTPTPVEVDTTNLKPAEGETDETVEAAIISSVGNVALESQAIDAAVASSIASAMSDSAPESGEFETLYAIDETQITPAAVVDVTQTLREAENPENVTVLIDDVVPDAVLDPTSPTVSENTKELAVAMESMVVAMGGKVVRSFGDYVKARAARQAK